MRNTPDELVAHPTFNLQGGTTPRAIRTWDTMNHNHETLRKRGAHVPRWLICIKYLTAFTVWCFYSVELLAARRVGGGAH